MRSVHMKFRRRPSVAAYMLRALVPPLGLRRAGAFPPLRASWLGHRIEGRHLGAFLELTGLSANAGLPLLYPHVLTFPLLMTVLTHPALPIPIWRGLQIRNHLLQHRPIAADATVDVETRVAGQRILERGTELDLHTTLRVGGETAWESLNTFYYRGRFGVAQAASLLAAAPAVNEPELARWHMPRGPGWRFARLTGDYNGIHVSDRYARLFGFRRAFHHPPLVLGQCLARLPEADAAGPQRLDAWLKGPVYYGSDVRLLGAHQGHGTAFALSAEGEARPAILGNLSRGAAASRLLDDGDRPA